jgi:hypothetical protein
VCEFGVSGAVEEFRGKHTYFFMREISGIAVLHTGRLARGLSVPTYVSQRRNRPEQIFFSVVTTTFWPASTNDWQRPSKPRNYRGSFVRVQLGIEFPCAFRANAVAKLCLGMIMNVLLNLLPIPLIIPYALAGCADWQETA